MQCKTEQLGRDGWVCHGQRGDVAVAMEAQNSWAVVIVVIMTLIWVSCG